MNERIFLEMIRAACLRHDVRLTAYSDGWLLRMQKGSTIRQVIGANFDLNDQASAAIARDKAATSALLNAANIDHVSHTVLRSSDMPAMHEAHLVSLLASGDVVIKPLEGGKGDFVKRISSAPTAREIMEQTQPMSWAASPYVEIDHEVRVVVVDGDVRLAYAKTEPVVMDGLKFFNLTKGARAQALKLADVADSIRIPAVAATAALGLRMAAVDVVVKQGGETSVLEVNAAFSLMHYAQTNKATYEEVALLYDRLVADMFIT